MRRFSQRNYLVTLSDINITPLLDLAFVLLIIFVITTPLLETGMDLKLPTVGRPDQKIDKKDIRTVEIDPRGRFMLERKHMTPAQIEAELLKVYRANPNLVVYIRSDQESKYKYFSEIIDRCQRHGITRFSMRGAEERR